MATINQLCNKRIRSIKIKKSKTPALNQSPQRKGICVKVYTRSPKKPNSAARKVAKIQLSNLTCVNVYIPGEGHNLQQYSQIYLIWCYFFYLTFCIFPFDLLHLILKLFDNLILICFYLF